MDEERYKRIAEELSNCNEEQRKFVLDGLTLGLLMATWVRWLEERNNGRTEVDGGN